MYGDGYSRLGFAIVEQAVKDYRKAKARLKKHPNSEDAKADLEECTNFLKSPWCELLLQDKLSPDRILKKLEEE